MAFVRPFNTGRCGLEYCNELLAKSCCWLRKEAMKDTVKPVTFAGLSRFLLNRRRFRNSLPSYTYFISSADTDDDDFPISDVVTISRVCHPLAL